MGGLFGALFNLFSKSNKNMRTPVDGVFPGVRPTFLLAFSDEDTFAGGAVDYNCVTPASEASP